MTLLTLIMYLLGSREAILRVARSRQSLWLGLLFVLAAGFAREYDGEDLLAEPWHLLIPLAASVVSSAVLYGLVRLVAAAHRAKEPLLVPGYLDFLGLYWMTAPLALLYAIPFERFLTAADSVKANLWLLALVAAWRVLLMSRVVSVIYQAPLWATFATVMLFADTVAIVILFATPVPIVSIMGGIRLSESENVLQAVLMLLRFVTVVSWPIWAIATGVALFRRSSEWHYVPITGEGPPVALHLWAFGAVALVAWAFVLPFTQPEQQLRQRVERDLRAGRIEKALATMSAHERSDFPPHWDPPPRVAYGETNPNIVDVYETLDRMAVKPWVRQIYGLSLLNELGASDYSAMWSQLSIEEVERRVAILERLPNRQEGIAEYEWHLRNSLYRNELPDELRARIVALLKENGIDVSVDPLASSDGKAASMEVDP